MTRLIEQFIFSASVTGPICLMLVLGVFLKRIGLINENFIEVASKLVFLITLPAMLFLSIIRAQHDFAASASLLLYGLIANLVFFILTSVAIQKTFAKATDHGVIVQGGFRANTAIIALAYVANIFSNEGVALGAIYVAAMTLLYNIQAVIALAPKRENSGLRALQVVSKTLTKNPLILSIMLGFVFYFLSIPVPKMVIHAGQYAANMTLPLALLCTGGSLDVNSLTQDKAPAWCSTFLKLVLSPLLITTGAVALGFSKLDLGIIFLMSAAPTAASSYPMARAMGGNATLAANIIALTTVFSLFTCTIGIFILSIMQLI